MIVLRSTHETSQPRFAAPLNGAHLIGLQPTLLWTPKHYTKKAAAYTIGPNGIGASSTTDNAFQIGQHREIQNADSSWFVCQFTAGAYAASSGYRRLFSTRGTTVGDGNRRGFEFIFYRASSSVWSIQVFDGAGSRSSVDGVYSFPNPDDKALITVAANFRRTATHSYFRTWTSIDGVLYAASAETSIASRYGDDATTNLIEVCGSVSGFTTFATGPVYLLVGGPGALSEDLARHVVRDPYGTFFPRRSVAAMLSAAAPTYTLSAPTYVPGSIASTGLTARVTVTAA